MEIDDDFGDLYSDVFVAARPEDSASSPPLAAAAAATSTGATSSVAAALNEDDWLLGGATADESPNQNPSKIAADVADQEEPKTVIPGLGTAVSPTESDDWDDSDSEDDLKIVLNDTEHGAMDDLGYGDRDEEEDLVIVTNDDQIGALDQDWGEEGAGPGGEGEGKEGDASKVSGLGGPGGTGPSRIGYNSHAFHQHHSMYKVEMHACYRSCCYYVEILYIQLHIFYNFVIVFVSQRECPLVDVIQIIVIHLVVLLLHFESLYIPVVSLLRCAI